MDNLKVNIVSDTLKVLNTNRTLFVDVDRTLVFFSGEKGAPDSTPTIFLETNAGPVPLIPHTKNIELLKQFKARGIGVVVWSQGGPQWAETVVRALELTDYVDVVLGKPDWLLDDKKATAWIGKRFYADPTTGEVEDFTYED